MGNEKDWAEISRAIAEITFRLKSGRLPLSILKEIKSPDIDKTFLRFVFILK